MKKLISGLMIGVITSVCTMSAMAAPADHRGHHPVPAAHHFGKKPLPPQHGFKHHAPQPAKHQFNKQAPHSFNKFAHRYDHKGPAFPPKHR